MFWLRYEELRDLTPLADQKKNHLMHLLNRYYINDHDLVPFSRWCKYSMRADRLEEMTQEGLIGDLS